MLRALAVIGAALVVAVAWAFLSLRAGMDRRYGPLHEMSLLGATVSVERFAGDWYSDGVLLMTRVRAGAHPTLAVRFSRRCDVFAARVVGDGLEVNYECPSSRGVMELRFTSSETVVWSKLGEGPSWCGTCSPRLRKADAWERAGEWVRILTEVAKDRARSVGDACELWAVRNL